MLKRQRRQSAASTELIYVHHMRTVICLLREYSDKKHILFVAFRMCSHTHINALCFILVPFAITQRHSLWLWVAVRAMKNVAVHSIPVNEFSSIHCWQIHIRWSGRILRGICILCAHSQFLILIEFCHLNNSYSYSVYTVQPMLRLNRNCFEIASNSIRYWCWGNNFKYARCAAVYSSTRPAIMFKFEMESQAMKSYIIVSIFTQKKTSNLSLEVILECAQPHNNAFIFLLTDGRVFWSPFSCNLWSNGIRIVHWKMYLRNNVHFIRWKNQFEI